MQVDLLYCNMDTILYQSCHPVFGFPFLFLKWQALHPLRWTPNRTSPLRFFGPRRSIRGAKASAKWPIPVWKLIRPGIPKNGAKLGIVPADCWGNPNFQEAAVIPPLWPCNPPSKRPIDHMVSWKQYHECEWMWRNVTRLQLMAPRHSHARFNLTPQLAARKQDDLGYRSAARVQLVACFSAPAISLWWCSPEKEVKYESKTGQRALVMNPLDFQWSAQAFSSSRPVFNPQKWSHRLPGSGPFFPALHLLDELQVLQVAKIHEQSSSYHPWLKVVPFVSRVNGGCWDPKVVNHTSTFNS